MNEQANCLRCGSRLPAVDEGLCPTCGTPFGARTMAISVGADELKRAHEASRQAEGAIEPADAGGGSPGGSKRLLVLVAVAVLVVAALLAGVLLFLVKR